MRRCLKVELVEGVVDAARVQRVLNGRRPAGEGRGVVPNDGRMSLAVATSEEDVAAWAKTVVAAADGTLLTLKAWLLSIGTYPDPRGCRLRIRLIGMSLILYDEAGVEALVRRFGRLEQGSAGFSEGGALTSLEAMFWASGPEKVTVVVTTKIVRALFPV